MADFKEALAFLRIERRLDRMRRLDADLADWAAMLAFMRSRRQPTAESADDQDDETVIEATP